MNYGQRIRKESKPRYPVTPEVAELFSDFPQFAELRGDSRRCGFHSQEACEQGRHIAYNTSEVLCYPAGSQDYREDGAPHAMEPEGAVRRCSDWAVFK